MGRLRRRFSEKFGPLRVMRELCLDDQDIGAERRRRRKQGVKFDACCARVDREPVS
jgi:hypothetical protein